MRSGIIDCSDKVSASSESMSRDERPKGAVLSLATERMVGGVRNWTGKGWNVLYSGRVTLL